MAETTISSIIADIEEHNNLNPLSPISKSTLLDLQSFLNHQTQIQSHNFNHHNPPQLSTFWVELSTYNLSISSIINPISSTMDSTSSSSLSLFASNVYLSLFLSPKAPVFSLFTPMSFLSLLHSIHLSLKCGKEGPSPTVAVKKRRKGGKGKRVKVSKNNSNNEYGDDNGDGGSERVDNEFDVKLFLSVLEKLGVVLSLVHLGRFPDSLKSLVQTVVEIPVLGIDLCGDNSGNSNKLCDFCASEANCEA